MSISSLSSAPSYQANAQTQLKSSPQSLKFGQIKLEDVVPPLAAVSIWDGVKALSKWGYQKFKKVPSPTASLEQKLDALQKTMHDKNLSNEQSMQKNTTLLAGVTVASAFTLLMVNLLRKPKIVKV